MYRQWCNNCVRHTDHLNGSCLVCGHINNNYVDDIFKQALLNGQQEIPNT